MTKMLWQQAVRIIAINPMCKVLQSAERPSGLVILVRI
jgi:hypothetical protein